MAVSNQRKFIVDVDRMPFPMAQIPEDLVDHYSESYPMGDVVRLRAIHKAGATQPSEFGLAVLRLAGAGLFVKKSETEISEGQYNDLVDKDGHMVWKSRYSVAKTVGQRDFECLQVDQPMQVDVYGAGLTGLVIAQIDFTDEETAERMRHPNWAFDEITELPSLGDPFMAADGSESVFRRHRGIVESGHLDVTVVRQNVSRYYTNFHADTLAVVGV